LGFWAAVKRTPNEVSLNRAEAFSAYTLGAAYSSFQEKSLGSLEPGKWADFFVLNRNLLNSGQEPQDRERIEATFFAGELAFERK
jgi:predicted amidohydrolase YtcJ